VETTTVVFRVVVLTLLWGGFTALLVNSMKAQKRRSGDADD